MKSFSVPSVVPNCPWLLCLVSVGFEKLGFLLCWFYNHRNFPHFGDCASQHYLGGKLDTLIFCSDNSPTTILRSGNYWINHETIKKNQRIRDSLGKAQMSICHLPKGLGRCFLLNSQQLRLENCQWLGVVLVYSQFAFKSSVKLSLWCFKFKPFGYFRHR